MKFPGFKFSIQAKNTTEINWNPSQIVYLFHFDRKISIQIRYSFIAPNIAKMRTSQQWETGIKKSQLYALLVFCKVC